MQYPHPLSRKLFTILMSLHVIGSAFYFIPGFSGVDAPVLLSGGFGVVYALLAALTLYGFVKKLSWAWIPIVVIYVLSIVEAFVFSKYQPELKYSF